jgi:hypothetical protein
VVEDGEREGGSLAGSGLRDADDIATLACKRYGLGLDRGWSDVILLRECAKDRLSEAELVK